LSKHPIGGGEPPLSEWQVRSDGSTMELEAIDETARRLITAHLDTAHLDTAQTTTGHAS
jgi:hypothetical protein